MTYPTLDEQPAYLRTTIGARAIDALLTSGWLEPPPPAARETPRVYASQYVGVARVKGRYLGMWGARGQRQGPRRELTDQGERAAATDRALALGLDYLERRDGTREAT